MVNYAALQAGDIRLLHVAPLVYWTSYLVSTTFYPLFAFHLGLISWQLEAAQPMSPRKSWPLGTLSSSS